MRLEVAPADRPPQDLRARCYAALSEPQIHYLEQRVAAARIFLLGPAASPVGYAMVHDGAVVEFWASDAVLPQLGEFFYAAAERGGATSVLVKSYDPLMLVAASARPTHVRTIGVNCTSWSDERFEPPHGFAARPGRPVDASIVEAIQPGLYEHPEEIARDLEAGRVTIYEQDGEAVGCGLLSPIRDGDGVLDIGVGVLPAWRRKGVGELIVRHLKMVSLRERGARPVCGCAVENVASRRTLERAGFLTHHRILEFTW